MVDTNWIYGPIYGIRTLMANSAAFRTAVGAESVEAAKAVIYPFQAYNEDFDTNNSSQPRPRVILSYDQDISQKQAVSSWSSGYSVTAEFEFTPSSENDQTAAESFLSTIQTIVNQMLALEGTENYVIVEDMEAAQSVAFSDPDETNEGERYIWYAVRFARGLE